MMVDKLTCLCKCVNLEGGEGGPGGEGVCRKAGMDEGQVRLEVGALQVQEILLHLDQALRVRVSSHTQCFQRRFAEVNSPTNPSTYPSLLLIQKTSGRICVGIDLWKRLGKHWV